MRPHLAVMLLFLAATVRLSGQEPGKTGQVRVDSVPPGAIVTCDGVTRDETPLILSDLAPGDHLLVLRRQGHQEARRTVHLDAGQRTAVEFTLEAVRGLVLVHSVPSGAAIAVDGAERGTTPALITDLPLGQHRLTLSSQGCFPKEVLIQIEDRTPLKVDVTMAPDSATLSLDSEPSGAHVFLNGVPRGVTPCRLQRVPAGDNLVEIASDGYKTDQRTVKLDAGQQEEIRFTLTPMPAELTVVSIPAGARIYVNDQFRGESPLTLPSLEPGDWRIRAELTGYAPMARTIGLNRAAKVTEEFRLQGNSGAFEITTQPSGVKIFVDGREVGVTAAPDAAADRVSDPLQVTLLAPGAHTVELTRTGYYSKTLTVEIETGKTKPLHEELKRRFIPDYEVRTSTEVHKGVLMEIDPLGNIRLEVRPGIFKTVPAADMTSKGPLRKTDTVLDPARAPDAGPTE